MATYIYDEIGIAAVTADGTVWNHDPCTSDDYPPRPEGEIAAAVALIALIGGFPVLRIRSSNWPAFDHGNAPTGLTIDGKDLPARITVVHRWATADQLLNADLRHLMFGNGHPASDARTSTPVVGENGERTGYDNDGYLTVTHWNGRVLRRVPDRGAARNKAIPSRWSGHCWTTRVRDTIRIDEMDPGHAWRAAQVMIRNAYETRTHKADLDEAFAAEQGFTSSTSAPTSVADAERMVRSDPRYRALLTRGRVSLTASNR